MKYHTSALAAIAAFTVLAGSQARADNFVTITPTGATAATVVNRWTIGSGLSGLSYDDSNSGFGGATGTNFFTITGAAIPALGSSTAFTSYLPTGFATAQGSVGTFLTPNSYSGLTYAAGDLGFGPLSFYAIHHSGTGDYVALIKPGAPTVTDIKAIPLPGGPLTPGGTGYFAWSYASDVPKTGWNANDFYYLRTDPVTGNTWFGSMIPALGSGPIDRYDLGVGGGYTDLAYTTTNVGFGFGPSQFYYLRLDPTTNTTFFGRLDPLTGTVTDIQNLGGVFRTLVFTTTNVGYGANNFYSIGRAAQTITFAAIPAHTACDVAFTVNPTASSGLVPVTLAVTSGPATISGGNLVTLTGTGTVILTASQAGDANFAPAPDVVQSFAVTACVVPPTAQTITFFPIPAHTACDASFTLSPTATSGLPVTLVVTSGPATISGGNVVALTGVGTVVITASQPGGTLGGTTYSAATSVPQSFVVSACVVPLIPQTITFVPIVGHTACDAAFTLSPTATSGLPVTLVVTSGPATVSGNTVTLTHGTGMVVLTASQAGNGIFSAAPSVAQSFSVFACAPIPQAITFAPIPAHAVCDPSFTLNPTSSSGLAVTLTVTSGPATVSGNTVTLTGAGSVTLRATQAGNGTYSSATPASQTFVVSGVPVITNDPLTAAGTVGVPFSFTLTASGSPTGFTAFNLPAGLFLNPVTGVISGTPTTPDAPASVVHAAAIGPATSPVTARWLGPTFVTVTATNGTCVSLPVYLIITITNGTVPPCVVPVITNNPLTATGTVGIPFSYTLTASGSPTGFTAFNLPAGLSLNSVTGVISGTPTTPDVVASVAQPNAIQAATAPVTARWLGPTFVTITAINGDCTSLPVYLMIVISPANSAQPTNKTVAMGSSATFSAGTSGTGVVTFQWQKDGVNLPGATNATLTVDNVQSGNVGFYTVAATSGGVTTTTAPALLAMSFTGQVAGSASLVAADIHHPNGNVYDQVLLTGAAASVKANSGKIVRVSFVDLTDDIIQAEFSGEGILTVNLENASGPAAAIKYNQPDVAYMKGHASIAVTGANGTTNLSVFSVGRTTATNQALFQDGTTYDGWADIALVTVDSADGQFGGVRTANANYFRANGVTGLYAPGVQLSGPMFIGDVDAAGSAKAVIVVGSVADARITGGNLFQDNGGSVEVSGMTRLQFTGGASSQGTVVPAQANRAQLMSNGVNVTNPLALP